MKFPISIISYKNKIRFYKKNYFKFIHKQIFVLLDLKYHVLYDKIQNYYFFDQINDINLVPEDIRLLFLLNKNKLKNRKIKKYTDNDWWKYGAVRNLENMLSDKNRIYVAPKTRLANPFFMGQSNELYSGSLLGIFPKKDNIDLEKSIMFFNSDIFKNRLKQFFIMIEDKFNFTPSVLGKIPLNLNEII
jgi:hypothetical protein